MRMYKYLISALLLTVLSSACGPKVLVDEQIALPDGRWTYADSLVFQAEIQDTSRLYDIALVVKHHISDFGFQNLYVRIHTHFPQGKTLAQPLSLDVAAKGGGWMGKCSGKSCTLAVPIQQNAYFNETGKYRFVLEQYMRQDSIPGVLAMGLRITDAGPRPDK